ncbi:MAG: hypothetical protein FWD61_12525 [Phycisphaerales bacterium]|nr:hypothetical protein [Phycisphaerales bacterium]
MVTSPPLAAPVGDPHLADLLEAWPKLSTFAKKALADMAKATVKMKGGVR